MSAIALPFADLTPHRVLDLLDLVGLHGDGRLLQLNSYENRVFLVWLEDGSAVVAKFYRPGRWSDEQILEEHAFGRELAAAEIPVVAPLSLQAAADGVRVLGDDRTLAVTADHRFAVTPNRPGRPVELEDPQALNWIGRFLGRIHQVGGRGRFVHRRRLDLDTLGRQAFDRLVAGDALTPAESGPWQSAARSALALVAERYAAVPDAAWLRVHGDCHPGNLLWTQAGPHFVDLDDAGTGLAVQDLWMLLPGDVAGAERAAQHLLEGYESIRDFDRREIGLVDALRTLRMIHHSAWIAERWDDPAFPAAFPWYGSAAYWSQQATQLREQCERMSGDEA